MKVLKPVTDAQIISIIPRIYSQYVVLYVYDESNNTELSYNLTTTQSNDYLNIVNNYNLVEGRWYNIKVQDVGGDFIERVNNDNGTFEFSSCLYDFYREYGEYIYKDKVFCTNQEINQNDNEYYTINKDNYVQEVSNNEFIIIE